MANKPKGGRPPGRRGKGGVGPGPGYRPGSGGGGTRHGGGTRPKGSSGSATRSIVIIMASIYGAAALAILGALGYLAHGWGLI